MYNKEHDIINKLNQLENKVETPSYNDCKELRQKIYSGGLYICKVLLQKTGGDVDKAVELYNDLNCSV